MTIPPCPCGQPEQWRAIPGWEGLYEVSDHGRARSLDRLVRYTDGRSFTRPGRMLRRIADKDGRCGVRLYRSHHDWAEYKVAVAVLLAFVGPRPTGWECCHNDGDCTNDHRSNLRWDTKTENMRDVVRHGQHWATSKAHCAQGHPLSHPNLVVRRLPKRVCLTCKRARGRATEAKRRAAKAAEARESPAR